MARAPAIPVRKGRAFYESCPDDNARLEFDPYRPQHHRCSQCGRDWQGERFDQAWVRQFQEWHAKRLVEAGILYRLEGAARYARYVRDSLRHFVRHYQDYPLANNLLGPTRLFQSTYLEAFWLVDMVAAYDLTREARAYTNEDHHGVRGLFYASCEVVRSYDEGVSNRQAFNNAGMGAVALLYEDEALLAHVLQGPHGFSFHMRESLLEDGLWYEGETYHFATLDHLLDLAEMARHRGIDLYGGSSEYGSLRPMFDGPLKVMLPDLTFPSRKDSWFGRGIGYHKDVYELGFARYGDAHYGGLLAHAYANGAERREVSWRSFLYLKPELPQVNEAELRPRACEPMPGTGVAVLRRDAGRVYASLEYGHYGGGHGHPDRLHLNLHADGIHWLLDPGTGWYHVPELGWYRSSLAHNTVVVDGASQNPSEGELLAFGDEGGFQIAQARVEGAYPGVKMRRTLCLGDGFLIDVLDVEGTAEHHYDWAVHTPASLGMGGSATAYRLGDRDGYEFLADVAELSGDRLDVTAESDGKALRMLQLGGSNLYRAEAPGLPLCEEAPLATVVARAQGCEARFATAYLWGAGRGEAAFRDEGGGVVCLETGDRRYRLLADERPGVAVVAERLEQAGPRLERLAWFGRREAALGGVSVRADRRLAAAAFVRQADGLYCASLPGEFGELRVTGLLTARVAGLPEGATAQVQDDALRLRQPPGTAVWLEGESPLTFFAGCENTLTFNVASYPPGAGAQPSDVDALQPSVRLPAGWRLGALEANRPEGSRARTRWALTVTPPGVPDALEGHLSAQVGGQTLSAPYRIVAPVSTGWRVEARDGSPAVTLEVKDERGLGGQVDLEVRAPWLLAEMAVPTRLELPPGGRASVRLPLPLEPLSGAPLGDASPEAALPLDGCDLWQLPGAEGSSGAYPVSARLTMAAFAGLSHARLPLVWSTPKRATPQSATEAGTDGRTVRLGTADQALWADRPWGGGSDASARGSVAWSAEGLTLRCEVQDDLHVTDANPDDLYENDALQVYFDFRPDHHGDRNFSPGVAAYMLAPSADKRSLRVRAIAGNREISNRGAQASWFTAEGVAATCTPLPSGYRVEAFFPYASLGAPPLHPGDVIGFDLALSDNDGTWYRNTQMLWSGARGRRCYIRGSYHDPREFGWLIVAGAAHG